MVGEGQEYPDSINITDHSCKQFPPILTSSTVSRTQTHSTIMNDMKNIKLNDGVVVPMLGYGTGTAVRLSGKEESIDFIKMAYSEAKLSHLDCAQRYFNEESIAVAMRDLGIKRDDVFITTKSTWGFLSNQVCCILIHVTSLAIAPQLRMERLR
jgi:hypothetical protein